MSKTAASLLILTLFVASALSSFIVSHDYNAAAKERRSEQAPLIEAFASRTYLYAGGRYFNVTDPSTGQNATFKTGQMYVEKLVPNNATKKIPLVFITGGGQSGTNWLNTPDGREGWASYLLREGYTVYLTDQAQRGRSVWLPSNVSSEQLNPAAPVQQVEFQFTAPEKWPSSYPQAILHTQWPGTGLFGDETFDNFYASQVQSLKNGTTQAALNNASYAALIDIIGEPGAIVVTHSEAGSYGWQLGDARPGLVKGILALEPSGPPFKDVTGPPFGPNFSYGDPPRPYGVTVLPVSYDPPIGADASMLKVHNVSAPNANLSSCILQDDPPRKLVNLIGIPALILTTQASYHAVYDYCTVKYLHQAGVNATHVNLPDVAIYGNGHFHFMEKNNMEIVENVVEPWLRKYAS